MAQHPQDDQIRRVLEWVFVRGDDAVTCELALDPQAVTYEFRTWPNRAPASVTVERFVCVTHAFHRQCNWEAQLVADGWTLHAYTSRLVNRAA